MKHPNNDNQYIVGLEQENKRLKDKLKKWKSLIKQIEEVTEYGWGKVLVTITQDGKRINIDTTFSGVNRTKT